MSNLSAFMQPNVEQVKNHKYVASHRIKGEDGKPVEWEICCISADEYARIRGACIRQVPVAGKKGQYTQQLDTYTRRVWPPVARYSRTSTTPSCRTAGGLPSRRS